MPIPTKAVFRSASRIPKVNNILGGQVGMSGGAGGPVRVRAHLARPGVYVREHSRARNTKFNLTVMRTKRGPLWKSINTGGGGVVGRGLPGNRNLTLVKTPGSASRVTSLTTFGGSRSYTPTRSSINRFDRLATRIQQGGRQVKGNFSY